MKRACIAVVDAARARLYTYQELEDAGQELREVSDLANPGRRLRPSEQFSDTRPGTTRAPGGQQPAHTYDDHRDAHIEQMDLVFAKDIVAELDRLIRHDGYVHVIIVASPKMLGDLRKVDNVLHRSQLVVDEVPRDLIKLTSSQMHDHLASLKLIPPRQRLASSRG